MPLCQFEYNGIIGVGNGIQTRTLALEGPYAIVEHHTDIGTACGARTRTLRLEGPAC